MKNKKKKKASLQRDEDAAKKSFQVRKSNLMTIAGVNSTNKQKPPHQVNNTQRQQIVGDNEDDRRMSMYSKLVYAIKQFISYVLCFLSLGYINYHPSPKQIDDLATTKQSNTVSNSTLHTANNSSSNSSDTTENDNDDYYSNVSIVGLDCEMVGGGRGGYKSLLARCSVVTLDISSDSAPALTDEDDTATTAMKSRIQQHLLSKSPSSLDDNLIVLYDKYVIPKGGISKITDYRTQWSGITKDTYKQPSSSIPIVSFQTCQNEITTLFSSINSKKVIVVGHALENDFDVLEIQHPTGLIRDTAFYKPYMRSVRNKKMYSRKLSHLTEEYLGITIQQSQQPKNESSTATSIGHSSVEDAAAALRLYWIKANEWERSLGYPLSTKAQQACQVSWNPIKLYLDGCNLPIGIRGDGVNFNDLLKEGTSTNNIKTISTETIRLTSRKRDNNHPSNISTIDWMPIFQSALSSNCSPKLKGISVMFDGAKFGSNSTRNGSGSAQRTGDSFDTRVFAVESKDDSDQILIEITEKGVSADDVLFHKCLDLSSLPSSSRRVITLSQVIDILSSNINDGDNDTLQNYIVIRRKAGGSKTHRRLFDKLHLRRPNEGALCLSALTAGLQRHSLRIAKELQRERGSVERVIECELRNRDDVRNVVVTDDVYLTDRLVKNGVLVLSYKQLSCMWL